MTQEEKAKHYDEAIQRARQFIETPYLENSDDVVGYIFPELKESEDERIRKKIIALFKGQIHSTSEEDNKKFVAWLEKQGEQKPAWSERDFEILNGITNYLCTNACELEGFDDWYEWLKSLKYRVQPQPKQEWSEEDEIMCTKTIFALAGFMSNEDKIDWLKNLKDRVFPQPKPVETFTTNKIEL